MRERLAALTSHLDPEDWLVLGVLACERKLAPSALAKLSTRPPSRASFDRWVEQGLLLDAGLVQGFAYAHSLEPERALALVPVYRPWILRELADREQLGAVSHAGRFLLGEGAMSPFMTSLYSGDLVTLREEQRALRYSSARGQAAPFVRQRLREALHAAIGGGWLEQRWGEWSYTLVEQGLADALPALDAVEPLYLWALEHAGPGEHPPLDGLLAEHALLRGDVATCRARTPSLPGSAQRGLQAALAYQEGDLTLAARLLDELLGSKRARAALANPSATALLALVALHREPSLGTSAKRLLRGSSPEVRLGIEGWPSADCQSEVTRALRTMIRHASQPQAERRRLSAHQLLAQAPGWVTLISGLTVELQETELVNRAAWARRLLDLGSRSRDAAYTWFARQTLHVARALSPEPLPELSALAPCQPGERLLCDLVEPEPEWRLALDALASFVKAAERNESVVYRRIAWYVDMAQGDLARPTLEEFVAERGWVRERRITFSELRTLRDTLPCEDIAVVQALGPELRHGVPPPEVFEALIGHPRVFNGARGRSPVEIVRGTCRVETRNERGHIVVQVEPGRAREGVNVVIEGEARLVVYRVSPSLANLISLLPNGIRIPESEHHQALPILARLADHVEIRSPSLGGRRAVVADSTPCLRISPEAGAWWVELGVRPFGESGRFFAPGLGRTTITSHDGEVLVDTTRDSKAELGRAEALLSHCPTLQAGFVTAKSDDEGGPGPERPAVGFALAEDELFGALVELRASELPCSLEWRNSRPLAARGQLTTASIHGALRRIKGWYLVGGSVDIDAVTSASLAELVTLPFTKSGRFLRLPNGDFLEVERRLRQLLRSLATGAVRARPGASAELGIPEAAFAVIQELLESAGDLQVDASAREHRALVQGVLDSVPEVPDGLRTTLRGYQLDGFRWLSRLSRIGASACLADDMGLGKTIQVLALLLERGPRGPALVVAPTSVCHNWALELRRFAPSLQALEYSGKARKATLDHCREPGELGAGQVVIASYALLQQDATELAKIEWHTAVLDEAQSIKNPRSLRAKAAFALRARFRVALSGTPVENHLGDLWSIFHFANPTLLGSFRQFRLNYLRPTDEAGAAEQRTALKRLLGPLLLRRRKDEVLRELPAITTLRHAVHLSPDEALRYALLRRQIHDKLRTSTGKREHKLQILAELTRLRRFCCHPRLVFPEAGGESAKLEAFLDLAEELRENEHRALVFSQFVDFLQLVRERLDERGLRYLYLDGSTAKEKRPGLVRAFQEGDVELFLISLKAGGFGLNLTAADYVIHLDPWWNPAVEAQATDRAHRIGQSRPVTAYRLITEHTIEERILALHEEKSAIADALLEESDIAADLDAEALMALVGADDERAAASRRSGSSTTTRT